MADELLRRHLTASHPGAHAPWFARSHWIDQMTDDQLERLHHELVRQGEDCEVVLDEIGSAA